MSLLCFSIFCFLCCCRQLAELEIQNEQNIKKLDKLKTETKDLQSHASTLRLSVSLFPQVKPNVVQGQTDYFSHPSRLTEWRVGESSDNSAAFTFLYETFHLQVVYQDGKILLSGFFCRSVNLDKPCTYCIVCFFAQEMLQTNSLREK